MQLNLPSNFMVGRSIKNQNHHFLEAFRQGLEQLREKIVTVDELRQHCKNFALDEQLNFKNICGSSIMPEEIDAYTKLIVGSSRGGDPDVEGIILCKRYRLKVYVIIECDNSETIHLKKINTDRIYPINNIDYSENDTIYIGTCDRRFYPVHNVEKVQRLFFKLPLFNELRPIVSANNLLETNFLILSCKLNQPMVLDFLCDKSILKDYTLHVAIGRSKIKMDDVDEEGHTASYYAIRSNNVELLKTLINPNYFFRDSSKLSCSLFKDYQELIVRKISLSEEMKFFVIDSIIRECLFRKSLNIAIFDENLENVQIKKLITAADLFDNITNEHQDSNTCKTSFIASFIAQIIEILKRKTESQYKHLPWKKIQFFFTRFDKIHNLDRKKVKVYLKSFNENVKNCPSYSDTESLSAHYESMRDQYSLNKILDYIKLAAGADTKIISGQLIILRALQVTGEYLKNTENSQNMSDSTRTLIENKMPNTISVLTSLRNSLSHSNNLNRLLSRIGIGKKSFDQIKIELEIIENVLTHVYDCLKLTPFTQLCNQIENSKNYEIAKELSEEFIEKFNLEKAEFVRSDDTIKNLINDMREIDSNKDIEHLLEQIENIIDSNEISVTYDNNIIEHRIQNINYNANRDEANAHNLIKEYYSTVLECITSKSKRNLSGILEFTKEIRKMSKSEKIKILTRKMDGIVSPNLKNSENEALNRKLKTLGTDTLEREIDNVLATFKTEVDNEEEYEKLKSNKGELEQILKKILIKESNIYKIYSNFENSARSLGLFDNSVKILKNIIFDDKITKFENNCTYYIRILENKTSSGGLKKDLQAAMLEMIILDLNSLFFEGKENPFGLQYLSKKDYEKIVANVPIMCTHLRNYLAHGNALIDSLSFDPLASVISHARIFAEEGKAIIAFRNLLSDPNMKEFLRSYAQMKQDLPPNLEHHSDTFNVFKQSKYSNYYLQNMFNNSESPHRTNLPDLLSSYDRYLNIIIRQ